MHRITQNPFLTAVAASAGVAFFASESVPPIAKVSVVALAVLSKLVHNCFHCMQRPPLPMRSLARAIEDDDLDSMQRMIKQMPREAMREHAISIVSELLKRRHVSFALEVMNMISAQDIPERIWLKWVEVLCRETVDSTSIFLIIDQIPPRLFFEKIDDRPIMQLLLRGCPENSLNIAQRIYGRIHPDLWRQNGMIEEVGEVHMAILARDAVALEKSIASVPRDFFRAHWPVLLDQLADHSMFSKSLIPYILRVLQPGEINLRLLKVFLQITPHHEQMHVLQLIAREMPYSKSEKIGISLNILNRMIENQPVSAEEITAFVQSLDIDFLVADTEEIQPLMLLLIISSHVESYQQVFVKLSERLTIQQMLEGTAGMCSCCGFRFF